MRQGASRLGRGHSAFRAAWELAQEKGWPLRWELMEAPAVPHDAAKMISHLQCPKALGGGRQ
jgi:hypothetical protein